MKIVFLLLLFITACAVEVSVINNTEMQETKSVQEIVLDETPVITYENETEHASLRFVSLVGDEDTYVYDNLILFKEETGAARIFVEVNGSIDALVVGFSCNHNNRTYTSHIQDGKAAYYNRTDADMTVYFVNIGENIRYKYPGTYSYTVQDVQDTIVPIEIYSHIWRDEAAEARLCVIAVQTDSLVLEKPILVRYRT